MRKSALTFLCLLAASSIALAQQRQPAQLGTTAPTTGGAAQSLDFLDQSGKWDAIGSALNGTFYKPSIMVTDTTVGMLPGGVVDNSPFVANLMAQLSPGSNGGATGYDVIWPGIPGQTATYYYYSQPIVLSRGAHYHCASTGSNNSVRLMFAAGIDGVIQEDGSITSDGGTGTGMVEGCLIGSMSFGGATANPAAPNTLTGAANSSFGPVAAQPWGVGDGIIASYGNNGYIAPEAIMMLPPGTYLTAVSGATITPSNPISPYFGYITPQATAVFTETGTNNFVNNDAITVGGGTGQMTYTAVSAITNATPPNSFLIGVDFNHSAANLVALINSTTGEYATYTPTTTGPSAYESNRQFSAAYNSTTKAITFTTNFGGPATNTFASVYTPAGTAAGSFGGATFSGGNATTTLPVSTWRLPAAQAYAAQTYAPQVAKFVGSLSAGTLTVSSVTSGTIKIGMYVFYPGVTDGQLFITGGSGLSWTVSNAGLTAASQAMTADDHTATFNGTITGNALVITPGTLSGNVVVGQPIIGYNTNPVPPGTFIASMGADTLHWTLNNTVGSPISTLFWTGAAAVTVISGPRPLHAGSMLWGDGIPFGTTVLNVNPFNSLPQSVFLGAPSLSTASQQATVTHPPGAEEKLWSIPAALRRDVASQSQQNFFFRFPIGLIMPCSEANGFNCTNSTDIGNHYSQNLIGRNSTGNNSGGSISQNEAFDNNYIVDVYEGEELGSTYVNLSSNSPDNGHGKWSMLMNCANQNTTILIGGYQGGGGHACADQVGIYPPTPGGPLTIGPMDNTSTGPSWKQSVFGGFGGFSFNSGNDNGGCVRIGGAPAFLANLFSMSSNGCLSNWSALANNALGTIDWSLNGSVFMQWAAGAAQGGTYPGYAGVIPLNAIWRFGLMAYNAEDFSNATQNARNICMSLTMPTSANHKKGDICFNTNPTHGGPVGWTDMADGANFEAWGTTP
jgi:hypothetical protein